MPDIKTIFDKIKKNGKSLGEQSSNIISHGKEILSKGKDLITSKEANAVIGFAKKTISQGDKNSTEDVIHFTDVLEIGNKVMDIVDNDVSIIADNVQGIVNTINEDSTEIQVNNQLQEINPVEEDTFFEDNLNKLYNASQNGLNNLKNPEEVARALMTLQMVANDTVKYVEEQETKREEIKAKRDIAIEKIKVIREAINNYLDKTFDERKEIFSKQFECVDEALKSNNTELLAISLNSINSLAAQSPFKALADLKSVQNQLLDDNTEWDI